MILELKSPAKINLCLFVSGRRPDGYHNIETIFQMISLYDRLVFSEALDEEIHISVDNKYLPADRTNLAYKAAFLLKERFKIKKGIHITIAKIIPVAAGLAGGSSNAATTLLALNKIWGLSLDKTELIEIAKLLGSDVPFFLFGTQALGLKKGDHLERITIDFKGYIVLVNPGIFVSSKWAYENLNCTLTRQPKYNSMKEFYHYKRLMVKPCIPFENDLELSVAETYPVISLIKEKLQEYGAEFSLMSGSGSTVFGVFDNIESAISAKEGIRLLGYRWWIKIVEPVLDIYHIYDRDIIGHIF